jgi:hypothetical protein
LVTLTITVTDPSTGMVPTGFVEFLDGTTVIAKLGLNVQGMSTVTRTFAKGAHTIKAVFLGSTNFGGSTSGSVALTVS